MRNRRGSQLEKETMPSHPWRKAAEAPTAISGTRPTTLKREAFVSYTPLPQTENRIDSCGRWNCFNRFKRFRGFPMGAENRLGKTRVVVDSFISLCSSILSAITIIGDYALAFCLHSYLGKTNIQENTRCIIDIVNTGRAMAITVSGRKGDSLQRAMNSHCSYNICSELLSQS